MKEIQLLDLDGGVRTFGDFQGKRKQFVFITRSPREGFTLMIYERESRDGKAAPGRRLEVKELHDEADLGKSLRSLLSKPVRAYIY